MNAMAFLDRNNDGRDLNRETDGGVMLLATGGEDGVLRVWELHADARSECGSRGLTLAPCTCRT